MIYSPSLQFIGPSYPTFALNQLITEMEKINILIADDHQLIRDTWSYILNNDVRFNVIAAVASGEAAVEETQKVRPDVVLMDINMGEMTGFEATKQIRKNSPGTKVIGVSMHSMPAYAKKLFKMGATGYVTKNSTREELVNAIIDVHAGNNFVCEEVKVILTRQEMEPDNAKPDINTLSKRELEVVEFIKYGKSSKEIAGHLGVSLKTIEVHRYNILKKLTLPNAPALVNFLNHHGF